MKFLKYFLICALFFNMACYKDKGNYDYTELIPFELDTVGIQWSYSLQQGRELLVIDQKLKASDTTDYEYLWRLYQTTAVSSLTKYDTLSTDRKLSSLIYIEPGTTNTLELRITQKSTGLFKYYTFGVGTNAAIPDGWMVIYEKDGMTDLDLVRGTDALGYGTNVQDTVIRNIIYSGLGGQLLSGAPISVSANANGVYLATSGTGINRFKNNSFTRLQDQSDLFMGVSPPSTMKPQYVYNHGPSFLMYINDGVGYWSRTSTATGFTGPSILAANNVEVKYDAAPYIIYMLAKQGVLFDKINKRFLYQEQNAPTLVRFPKVSPNAKFDMDNIGKDLLWMGPKLASTAVANSNYRTAYFKDLNSSSRWLYIMDLTLATSTSSNGANSSVAKIDISNLPDIQNAKFYETSYSAMNTFYATSTKLYSFFYNGATDSYSNLTNPFTAPAGEEITAVRLLATGNTNTTMRRIGIATWNATTKEGKMYMYKIPLPTTGEFVGDPLVTTHQGKILIMETKTN